MLDNMKDRVNSDELQSDIANGVEIALSEFELAAKVDLIMGGDDEELVLDIACDSDIVRTAITELSVIDCQKQLSLMPIYQVQALAAFAYKINKAIEAELTATLESKL